MSMRIKAIVALSFAGAAAAAVIAGGAAYASEANRGDDANVRIVYEDCPEKNGGTGNAPSEESL
ncbi:hypothetical protein [Micromonospora sp. CPCC 206061]|uniref:hypothetical protein n=1 Tax=Micromonospora sp. CPCC 206061 TaxID=3122410 RepID=UPI002FF31E41